MNEPAHVMTHEQAAKYRADFLHATRKWTGETMEVLSPEAMEQHLAQVKQAQDSGAPF